LELHVIKFRVTRLTVSDGESVDIPEAGVVLFVGPNNAGKSQSLKDLVGHARDANYQGTSITGVEYRKEGTREEALEWANENLPRAIRQGIPRMLVPGWGEVQPTDFVGQWTVANLGILVETFMLYADGTTRLSAGNAQPSIDFRNQLPTHPIQRAGRDSSLEAEFNSISKSAFGLELTVDRYAGSVIPIRIGPRPAFDHNDGMPTVDYLDALAALPQLEEQGDGVKSLLGLMTQVIAGRHQVILVDEPEAFLHPPQARLLGRLLAQRANNQQVFIATHSADIVQGALEAGTPVTIIRLTREGRTNHAAVLSDAAVSDLWADPLLRYSDVLTGLFHDAVVLCESDSDCRYYASVRDHLFPEDDGARRSELLFTHCGGKARLPVVVKALVAVNVPVLVVADFDILRSEIDVKRTFEALGGDWATLAPKRSALDAALLAETRPLRRTATKDALLQQLDRAGEVLTTGDVDSLRAILKPDSGWDKVKRAGLSGVPQGSATASAQLLLEELQAAGLFVVPVGEIERFAPAIGGHGPAWVNEVLAQRAHLTPSTDAVTFITAIEAAAHRASTDPLE
jgi:energy-coupling factor transporter ATP-binding protein EcfA2